MKYIITILTVIILISNFLVLNVFSFTLEDPIKKYGYKEIQKSNDNTYIDVYISNNYYAKGVFGATVNLECNYDGLRKDGIDTGFEDIIFSTQHGDYEIKSLCSCESNKRDKFDIVNAYGVPGAPEISDEDFYLIHTVILKKVIAKNSATGKKIDITNHIGLYDVPIKVIKKK